MFSKRKPKKKKTKAKWLRNLEFRKEISRISEFASIWFTNNSQTENGLKCSHEVLKRMKNEETKERNFKQFHLKFSKSKQQNRKNNNNNNNNEKLWRNWEFQTSLYHSEEIYRKLDPTFNLWIPSYCLHLQPKIKTPIIVPT